MENITTNQNDNPNAFGPNIPKPPVTPHQNTSQYTPLPAGQTPSQGTSGQAVKDYQTQLNAQHQGQPGYVPLVVDGLYGPKTQAASQFQTTTTPADTTNPTDTTNTTEITPPAKTQDEINLANAEKEKAAKDKEIADAGAVASQRILDIQNGIIPLNAGEQAQVAGLQLQFQEMIDQQKLTNISASGTANIRGYQTGAAEYDPMFQIKTIGAIVTAGANKVIDLQIKEASAVAALTQAIKDNNIRAIKDAYSIADDARKNTQASIQDVIEKTQAKIKEVKDAQEKADKDYYDRVTKPIQDISVEVAKNGITDPKILTSIKNAKTVQEAITATGDSLQTATGQLGDYLQYKRDNQNQGIPVESWNFWKKKDDERQISLKSKEAYATAYASAKGKAAGEPSGITYDENGNMIASGNMSVLDIGRFNLAATRATRVFRETQTFKSTVNADFYIAKLKAATANTGSINDQEILDSISQFNTGGGRVTEAQVDIILAGKSFGDTVNTWNNKLKNGGVLSDKQRKQALELALLSADEFLKSYTKKYIPLSENLQKQGIPKEFWGIPSPEQLAGESQGDETEQATSEIENFQSMSAQNQKAMDSLRSLFPELGPQEIYQKLKDNHYL